MAIFDAGDVTLQQAVAFLDVTLREVLLDAAGTKAVANNRVGDYFRGEKIVQGRDSWQ